MIFLYISMEQAAFSGLGRRWPCCSRVESACMSVPGYGILQPLNTSHIVTPNDHYSMGHESGNKYTVKRKEKEKDYTKLRGRKTRQLSSRKI